MALYLALKCYKYIASNATKKILNSMLYLIFITNLQNNIKQNEPNIVLSLRKKI